ncbi:alpha-protein kinase 3 isoform X2 [Pygocentrus nattereri]|uniref:alpha-protein kinase 3 isoform X2 n=1 Tax=Pygocentrus nattereri TaxID=42514 RepID=UPI0018917512|nr:alpha-protein kinase 3 isoform X2 [Pygocentrus nattereri]
MTSRRPMIRSYSGNGRSGSQNGEDVPSPRLDSRNYLSNVRPENRYSNYKPSRSTFCTVMAQLTEETQPCFEITIKSKAVSEACNVKFTCVVTGYPVPELTWYKDDMELDRYCGLPKYEIFRNGKTHTLHIYNCTIDDAAIYQASARNSKGIVSCSGVLEVGAMSEFKIHQRFFAKLKQKAELKRREIEESRRRGKENIQQEQLGISQDRSLRKRRLPEGPELSSLSAGQDGEENEAKEEATMEEQPAVVNEEMNGLSGETHELSVNINQENDIQQLNHIHEKEEVGGTKQAAKEKMNRKKIRRSNGFDEPVTNLTSQDSGRGGGDTSEGMSLAKYLAQSLQTQAAEEQQKTEEPGITAAGTSTVLEKGRESEKEIDRMKADEKEKERESSSEREQERSQEIERERSRERERESSREREREKAQQLELEHRAGTGSEAQAKSQKEPEHQHKSALSSVFHSLKDIFFGKGKKLEKLRDNVEKETQPYEPDTSGVYDVASEQSVPMKMDQANQIGDLYVNRESPQQLPRSLLLKTDIVGLDLDGQTHRFITDSTQEISSTPVTNNDTQVSSSQEHGDQKRAEEKGGPEALSKAPLLPLIEATDDHTDEEMVDLPHESAAVQESTAPMDHVTEVDGEMHVAEERDDTADFTQKPEASLTGPNMTDLESTESCSEGHLSQTVSHTPLPVHSKQDDVVLSADQKGDQRDSYTKDVEAPTVEETAEENVLKIEGYSFIKGSEDKDKMGGARAGATEKTETVEMTERSAISLHGSRLEYDVNLREEPAPELGTQNTVIESDLKQNKTSIPAVIIGLVENEQQVSVRDNNSMDENISSAENDAEKVESIEERKEDSVEEKQAESTEENRVDVAEKKKDAIFEEKNVPSMQVALNITAEPEISKQRPSEIDSKETHVGSSIADKPKIYTKAQPERYMGESRDQSVAPPIVILPDTRETVIKNVAKMRATPVIPEIKITASEKAKREDTLSIPRIDVLISEPERVMQQLAQEVAHIFRDSEPKAEEPTDDAKRAPNEVTRDDRVVSTAQPVGVTPTQQERNVDLAPSDQRNQEAKPQSPEVRMGHREDQAKITSGRNRGNDSGNIPIINIACADDIPPSQEGQVHGKQVLHDTVAADNVSPKMQVPSIFTTHVESTPDNSTKKEEAPESLAAILRKVEHDLDHVGSSNRCPGTEKSAVLKEQNVPDKMNLENQISSDGPSSAKITDAEGDAERQRDKPAMDKLGLTTPVGPTLPPLSPASLRRLMAKNNPNLESQGSMSAISSADGIEKKGEESGGSTPTSTLSCESSPKMKRRDSLTLIPSATPEELASGARRKIYLAKTKSEDEGSDTQNKRDSPKMSPSQARRAAFLQLQSGQQTPPMERRSPLLGRRKATLEVPKPKEETSEETDNSNTESKPAEKEKLDPFKAPQVIRKIRGEPFSDASGHLKLWCQFFNVLSDSTIKWFRDEEEIVEVKRSAGDESQVALAIVQASGRDCGVYGCTIKNEYGTDTTDYLLSEDILGEFFLRDDIEVGEEIEMTPLLFTKGLVDPGYWGEKFFGRIMTQEVQIGEGYAHKTSRAKVIYGLDPVFESGSTCVAKVRNPIAYGTKEESNLAERNLEITKQECKIQNTIREYCKIFAAEARVIDNFGFSLEVIPLYLMYRPANTIPYATVEADLNEGYSQYCLIDNTGRLIAQTSSEVEQKCCTFQHWIYQWTNCNLLVTRLEGVDAKMTNIRIVTKSKGYQGLTDEGSPKILEQFVTQHQCNYYCGLLGLRPLKLMDCLQQQKVKTSRSPLLARRVSTGSSSPQLQKKGSASPQAPRKGSVSPKVVKKTGEEGENKPATKHKTVEVPKAVRMR